MPDGRQTYGSSTQQVKKCWFWRHQWTEWVEGRTVRLNYVYLRQYQKRVYFNRKCTKCGMEQEYHTEERYLGSA